MPVAMYLKDKQKKIESKYHQVTKQFETQYKLIHRKITSRFHREVTEIELVRSSLNDLITKSIASVEREKKSRSKTSIFSRMSIYKGANYYFYWFNILLVKIILILESAFSKARTWLKTYFD